MGMFSRVTSIFKSNVNTILEKMEDPNKILDQNIRNMESEYVKAKESVSKAKAEEIRLTRRVNELTTEALKWTKNAKLALTKGNEDLARKVFLLESYFYSYSFIIF
ncbi:PspA/IM30 family protein [Psychrilyobacter sp.]|uniref:PspA/IM30 family protein n=1 Tax=Psychrilyobacter sp. TaxID=2586924 RepID=UPI003019D3F2